MADETDLPWDDQTELFVKDIDAITTKKYGISIRELMLNPDKFADTEGALDKVRNAREASDGYFEDMMKDFEEEDNELETNLKKIDALYNQVSQVITSRANLARVPVMKAANVDLSNSSPEIIYIEQVTPQIDSLMTKLVNSSNYIGDLSTPYRKYMVGTWIFSGNRSYIISERVPDNPVTMIDSARTVINTFLDDAADRLESAGSK